jgi:type IV secretory pathway VirJ component
MARRFFPAILLLSVAGMTALLPAAAWAAPDSFKFGRLGLVPVVHPAGEPAMVAILFSGGKGIGPRETAMAQALAAAGALVFAVDTQRYLAAPNQKGMRMYPAVEFEALSQIGQKEMGLAAYHAPVLVGTGDAGAGVAYAAIAEAPGGTFAGAISDGFCAVIPSQHMFSRGSHLSWERKWPGPGIRVIPDGGLESPWIVFDSAARSACPAGPAADFVKESNGAQLIPAPAGAPPQEAWRKQLPRALAILAEKRRQEEKELAARGELRDLPVVEVRPDGGEKAEKDLLAVLLTGSGGFVGLDRRMGNQLSARGVPVVGLSSLAYFWKPRDPAAAARDLGRVLDHYLAAWHKSKAIVIGYSQGADVAPFMVDRLTAAQRAKVAVVALIGPSQGAQFDMHPDGWISNRPETPEIPVAPAIAKLKGARVLCIYGAQEKDNLCRQLPKGLVTLVQVPGDHGFGGQDAPQLADRFLVETGFQAMPGTPPPPPKAKAGAGKGGAKGPKGQQGPQGR